MISHGRRSILGLTDATTPLSLARRLFSVILYGQILHVFDGIQTAALQGLSMIDLMPKAWASRGTVPRACIGSTECSDRGLVPLDRLSEGGRR
jgi:hypothetical protein